MKVALDMMGGDREVATRVQGAIDAAKEYGTEVILVGDEVVVNEELAKHVIDDLPISVHHAEQQIKMTDKTEDALRKKRKSSIHECARLVKSGDADAMISAGHTGAMMAISKITLGSLKGIKRPVLAIPVPTIFPKPTLLLDAGANTVVTSEHLTQFAVMGKTYAEDVFHIKNPRLGLLSNGEEASKGNELIRKTQETLKGVESLNFIGPVEGNDLMTGEVDVVVTDGFTGNVVLKTAEGVASAIFDIIKAEVKKGWISMLGALLMKRAFGNIKRKFDYAEYGGSPLIGINGISIVCHGKSNEKAIKNAIRVARELHDNDANAHIKRGISELHSD